MTRVDLPDVVSSPGLKGTSVKVTRPGYEATYEFQDLLGSGMKGVVWRVTDSLGQHFALKVLSPVDYRDRSLVDEMSLAVRLEAPYFARVEAYGDATAGGWPEGLLAVVTEWIAGEDLARYVDRHDLTVNDYVILTEQLFTALAVLRRASLCHDDLHPGNILIREASHALTGERMIRLTVIDTGTVKRVATRADLLEDLRRRLEEAEKKGNDPAEIEALRNRVAWKTPDDHLRAVMALLTVANAVMRTYARCDPAERRFLDDLLSLFTKLTDEDIAARLDDAEQVVMQTRAMLRAASAQIPDPVLHNPFDFISAEMIRSDRAFAELFSMECPWLDECKAFRPLYLYGPRGCGKSSILRWLSLKAALADSTRESLTSTPDVGVYLSCSVELRSRFWLLPEKAAEAIQPAIIRFFGLLILDELFDTIAQLDSLAEARLIVGLAGDESAKFAEWAVKRLGETRGPLRFQGQRPFSYLRDLTRKLRWETWAEIQLRKPTDGALPDPSLVSDVCRELENRFSYFQEHHITILLDDYSNQRIPAYLQRQLNQTIVLAKQGVPVFKIASEYNGVDLEGIQQSREVSEVNIGRHYASLAEDSGVRFLADIVDIRLKKAKYAGRVATLIGESNWDGKSMPRAIAEHPKPPFYYHGLRTIHGLCSGDVALALDLVRKVFEAEHVSAATTAAVPAQAQHRVIQQVSAEEVIDNH